MKGNSQKRKQSYGPWGLWVAIGIIIIAIIFECNDKKVSRYQRSQQSYTTPASSETSEPEAQLSDNVPASPQTSEGSSTFRLTPSVSNEQDEYDDQYDNPDFDDLVPGDEFDEEFMGSEGDPEVYPKE